MCKPTCALDAGGRSQIEEDIDVALRQDELSGMITVREENGLHVHVKRMRGRRNVAIDFHPASTCSLAVSVAPSSAEIMLGGLICVWRMLPIRSRMCGKGCGRSSCIVLGSWGGPPAANPAIAQGMAANSGFCPLIDPKSPRRASRLRRLALSVRRATTIRQRPGGAGSIAGLWSVSLGSRRAHPRPSTPSPGCPLHPCGATRSAA